MHALPQPRDLRNVRDLHRDSRPAIQLADIPGVWRGAESGAVRAESTGHAELDPLLPGGGWPVGKLTELYPAADGIGELSLLLPAMRRLTQAGRRVVLVAPPYVPYSQALADQGVRLDKLVLLQPERASESAWALEQVLRSGSVALAIAWPSAIGERALRRLQVAAEAGGACAILYRPRRELMQDSPAALRMSVEAQRAGSLRLVIHKCRGAKSGFVTVGETARYRRAA